VSLLVAAYPGGPGQRAVKWLLCVLCSRCKLCVLVQLPEEESQPSTEVDLFVSAEKIMVLDTGHRVCCLCQAYL